MISAVIVAGGRGSRMGADINKVYLKLCGREIIARTVEVFENCDIINEIVIVTGKNEIDLCRELTAEFSKISKLVRGGERRQDSVYNGLCAAKGDMVAIHDAARCLVTDSEIRAAVESAERYGAAAAGVMVKDTLKSVDRSGNITGTIDRERTVLIQTPQVFSKDGILKCHEHARKDGTEVTDDCALFELYGGGVHVSDGSYENIKITTPEDLIIGERIIKRRERNEDRIRI